MDNRYTVELTSDAFAMDDSFIIYDNKKGDYYINENGMLETFEAENEAEDFCRKLNKTI